MAFLPEVPPLFGNTAAMAYDLMRAFRDFC
jgi:hypothetical protein